MKEAVRVVINSVNKDLKLKLYSKLLRQEVKPKDWFEEQARKYLKER